MQAKTTAVRNEPEVRDPADFQGRLRLCISRAAEGKWMVFARNAGIPKNTFQRYLDKERPSEPGHDHLVRIAKAAHVTVDWLLGNEPEARAPKPPYLVKGWQEVRSFTCLVEALLKIGRTKPERNIAPDQDDPTYSAAWKIIEASVEAVRQLANWTPDDWRAMHHKDHWARITRRREAEEIARALGRQEELPL